MRGASIALGIFSLAVAAAQPSYASDDAPFEEKCGTAPFGPDIPKDPATPDAKMAEIKSDVVAFLKASDQFQDCIDRTLVQGPKLKKDLSREQISTIQDRFARAGVKIMADNQAEKERVGDAFNALVDLRNGGGAKPAVAKPDAARPPATAPVIPSAPTGMLPDVRPTAKAKPLEKPAAP